MNVTYLFAWQGLVCCFHLKQTVTPQERRNIDLAIVNATLRKQNAQL